MKQEKSLAVNTILNIILKIFRIVVPIITGPYVARVLSESSYATYNNANTYVSVFLIFAQFGIYNYAIREASKVRDNPIEFRRTVTNIFAINTVTSIATTFVYLICVFIFKNDGALSVYLAFTFTIFANTFLLEWVNEALENYKFLTIKTIAVRLLFLVLVLTLVKRAEDVLIYTLIVSLIELINSLISFVYIKRRLRFDFRGFNPKTHIRPLINITLIQNINVLYLQLDRIMLEFLDNEILINLYTIPQTIANIITSLLVSVVSVGISRLSYYHGNNQMKAYNRTTKYLYAMIMLVIIPASIGLMCLSEEVVFLFGGRVYLDAAPTLMAFSVRLIINSHYVIMSQLVFYIKKKEKILVKALVLGGILNLIMNSVLLMTGTLSPLSAVITTTIAELIVNYILGVYARKHLNTPIRFFNKRNIIYLVLSSIFIPATIAVKALVGANYFLRIFLILPSCVLLYTAVLYAAKESVFMGLCKKVSIKLMGLLKRIYRNRKKH